MAHNFQSPPIDSYFARLREMRHFGGEAITRGLADEVIQDFIESGYDELPIAIERAYERFQELQESHPDFLALGEVEQIREAHEGLTNFYAEDAVNPYVAVSAAGPWVISLKGAVIYDCGGYGMLGLGHAPEAVLGAMNQPHVMANIMTASVSQVDFVKGLRREIGHARKGGTPYASFLCLNSGSESMSIASRIADINTRILTDPGARYEGRDIHGLTLLEMMASAGALNSTVASKVLSVILLPPEISSAPFAKASFTHSSIRSDINSTSTPFLRNISRCGEFSAALRFSAVTYQITS